MTMFSCAQTTPGSGELDQRAGVLRQAQGAPLLPALGYRQPEQAVLVQEESLRPDWLVRTQLKALSVVFLHFYIFYRDH